MSFYRCSYPVTPEVLAACNEFAEIGQILGLPAQGRSEKEIVRLLDNAHYEHITRLLNFIERMLSRPDSIGQRLLQQTDPFQFNQFLAELFLFSHLSDRLGKKVLPVIKGPSDKGPDIETQWGNLLVRIEAYSPIDFMGFQLIGKHIPPLFKYLDVVPGFSLKVSIKPADISVQGVCMVPVFDTWRGRGTLLAARSCRQSQGLAEPERPGTSSSSRRPGRNDHDRRGVERAV